MEKNHTEIVGEVIVEETYNSNVQESEQVGKKVMEPINPTAKTFKFDQVEDRTVDTQDSSYTFSEYMKMMIRNPLQIFPKSCNKYAFGILFGVMVTISIFVIHIMNKVIEDSYIGYRGFMKFQMIENAQSQMGARILIVIMCAVLVMLFVILLEKLMIKWLLKEQVDYSDLLANYGQITLLPSIFIVLSAILFFSEVSSKLIIIVLSIGMTMFSVSQIGRLFIRAKDAKNGKVAPVYFVAIIQSLIVVIVSIFMNVR